MKKNLLVAACLFFAVSGQAFAAQSQNMPQEMELKQKACQNVFSLINIDLSLMSPRGTAADVNFVDSANTNYSGKKDPIVPISNKQCAKQPCPCQMMKPAPEGPKPLPPQNKTSLFRIDLLHIFKIQIL